MFRLEQQNRCHFIEVFIELEWFCVRVYFFALEMVCLYIIQFPNLFSSLFFTSFWKRFVVFNKRIKYKGFKRVLHFSLQHFNEYELFHSLRNWKLKGEEEEEEKTSFHSLSDNSGFDSVKNKIISSKSRSVRSLFGPLNFHSFRFHSILPFI